MRLELHITPSGSTYQVLTVDRRAEYHAKVRNAGLQRQPDFCLREMRGKRVKAALALIALAVTSRRAAAEIRAFDWTAVTPRPDAPPPTGSAAA